MPCSKKMNTESKLAEAVLRRDGDALEDIVKERTSALLEAQKKLEMTRRLSDIGQLASTIAHELRNALGVIRAAAYNIRRKSGNSDFEKHLNNIEKNILESDQIIQNLLGYARVKEPIYEAVDIDTVLDESLKDMRERCRDFDVKIDKKMDIEKGLLIECDRTQITGLFINILDNAYKSLPDKRGRIEIAAGPDDAGEIFIISFKDDGVGIDKGDINGVFDPFFSKRARGIGLGLTVCRQIAELHGGAIEIASEPGKGTMVTVKLPVKHKTSLD